VANVLCAGFVCGDLVLRPVDGLPPAGGNRFVQAAQLTIGGCAANTAVAFARLLSQEGGKAALAGRVAQDALGALLRQALAQAGVDVAALLGTPGTATAINTALVTSSGERSFYVYPGACDFLSPEDLPDSLLRRYDHLHLGAVGALPGLAGAAGADVARRARALGLSVSLDITLNPPRDTAADVGPLLRHIDLFLPNLAEAQAVFGSPDVDTLLRRGLASGVRVVGIKLGSDGCVLAGGHQRVDLPAFPVDVVDTCGAGDAWTAAAVTTWLAGWPLAEIARFANAAGALCTLALGATAGMAEFEPVRRFAATTTDRRRLP
jgi:sugar/nucleoside kinase (ribokinase family)